MTNDKQIAKRVVVHGWGKIFNNVRCVCPSCHKLVRNYIFWIGRKKTEGAKERYCPRCGQKLLYPFHKDNEEKLVWLKEEKND